MLLARSIRWHGRPFGKLHIRPANAVPRRTFFEGPMPAMEVFNRDVKFGQWDNLAAMTHRSSEFDRLRDVVAKQLIERLDFTKGKEFPLAACLGYGSNHIVQALVESDNRFGIKDLLLLDPCKPKLVKSAPEFVDFEKDHGFRVLPVAADEENLPLTPNTYDLIISSMALHWTNDLPGVLNQVKQALKPDGCFIGSFLGGGTLSELRSSFLLAEQEREGGVSPHTSPLAAVRDAGNVLTRAGFALPTIDSIHYVNYYPDPFTLMHHLQLMGENNALISRRPSTPRDTIFAAAAAYQEMYQDKEGRGVPATFEVVFVIGWRPDPNQPKAAKRGSGEVSMKKLAEEMNTTIQSIVSKDESELTAEERKFLEDMEGRREAEEILERHSNRFSNLDLNSTPQSSHAKKQNSDSKEDYEKKVKEEQTKIAQDIAKKQSK